MIDLPVRRAGLSFIEVLIAGVVMTSLVIPLLIVFSSTLRTTEVSIQEIWAQHLATELLEQVRIMPVTVGFHWLYDRPIPNCPPHYPYFLCLAPTGQLPCRGWSLPTDTTEWMRQVTLELDTEEWTLTGAPLSEDPSPEPDPLIAEYSRIFLTALPEGFRRYLQFYRPIRSHAPLDWETNLVKVVVRIDWQSARTADRHHTRQLYMRGFIGNPRIEP